MRQVPPAIRDRLDRLARQWQPAPPPDLDRPLLADAPRAAEHPDAAAGLASRLSPGPDPASFASRWDAATARADADAATVRADRDAATARADRDAATSPGARLGRLDARAWRVLIALGAVALALVAWVWWQGRAQPVAVIPDRVVVPAAGASPATAQAAPAGAVGEVVVHVAGAVRHPGLVRLPAGSRVADALTAAGGATSARAEGSVNLARLLVDGEQIQVLASGIGAAGVAGPTGLAGAVLPGAAGAGSRLSLNSASAQQLEALPGIGPVLASRIVEFRTEHGGFRAVEQLTEVAGIGDALLSRLRAHVQV